MTNERHTIRLMTPEDPARLSRDLRESHNSDLRRRRAIVGLSLFAVASTSIIALRQMGIVRRLPEPRASGFDTDRVVGSKEAYSVASTPDAFFAVMSYATTAALAAMGGADRARKRPWIPLVMSAKVLVDSAMAGFLVWFQWAKLRAFCIWCLVTAGATFALLPLTVPEAMKAIRNRRL